MQAEPRATLRLVVDRDALASNWRNLDRLSGAAAAGAAVKANCYGLGVDACVPTLRDAGARDFFVAHWTEVRAVAAHVPEPSIHVLHGPVTSADAAFARATGTRPVINSLHQARVWQESGGGPCDVMVDTGINRLGIRPEELGHPAVRALAVDLLLSHLSSADEDSAENARQLRTFLQARTQVPHQRASFANSAGIALGEEFAFDLTRPGIALYGGIPRPELAPHILPVARIEAAVIQRRIVPAGETIGYNRAYLTRADTPVGVISLGYADGFLRAWGMGGGYLLSHGRKLPLLGKVSMDMTVVDLTAAPDLREGDRVEVPFDLPAAAKLTGLSQYELLTTLGRRLMP